MCTLAAGCAPGTLPFLASCTQHAECCGDNCVDGQCECVSFGGVGGKRYLAQVLGCSMKTLVHCQSAHCCARRHAGSNPTCFSGDSTVRVRGYLHPVTMRELRTGQHVECLHSGSDLMAPTTPTWCEVINFVSHAVQQQAVAVGVSLSSVCVCVHACSGGQ